MNLYDTIAGGISCHDRPKLKLYKATQIFPTKTKLLPYSCEKTLIKCVYFYDIAIPRDISNNLSTEAATPLAPPPPKKKKKKKERKKEQQTTIPK